MKLLKLLLIVVVVNLILVLSIEGRSQQKRDWGSQKPGWTWANWRYFWYWRHGSFRTRSDHNTICQQLWNVENDQLHEGTDYSIRLQKNVTNNSIHDKSNWRLFRYLKLTKIRKIPTYNAFVDVLSNFNPSADRINRLIGTQARIKYNVEQFVDETFKTRLFQDLYWFLIRERYIKPNKGKFKKDLFRIWFDNNNITHSHISGFENIFVGETVTNPKKISFRNWLQFYFLEQRSINLNYYGYINFFSDRPTVVSVMYSWRQGSPVSDNMFLGTSPEFEFALYTLCFYINPGKECECRINTKNIVVKTVPSEDGLALQNAFFDLKI